MSTPPDPDPPQRGPVLEPVRVLRPRRFDALAELMREVRQDAEEYETVRTAQSTDGTDEAGEPTQELPPVPAAGPAVPGRPLRRAVALLAVTAAALVGFGCALLLPGRGDAATPAQPSRPAAPTAGDPDGAGTLREGDTGTRVTELQERLLRIPDVYRDGPVDGRYDSRLTEAVARFQLWYGIRGDESGVYGNDTRQALESRTSLGAG